MLFSSIKMKVLPTKQNMESILMKHSCFGWMQEESKLKPEQLENLVNY